MTDGDDRPKKPVHGDEEGEGLTSNISNVTNMVVGRMGSMLGKGIGGLSSKLGGGSSWF